MVCGRQAAVAAAVMGCAVFGSAVRADLITLRDGNSTVQFNTTGEAVEGTLPGTYQWIVDGKNQLNQQWFWFRIEGDSAESPLSTLPQTRLAKSSNNGGSDWDTLSVDYTGRGLKFTVMYMLLGGEQGSRWSDLGESIRIANTTQQDMRVHFFQYSDFDLNGTPLGDSVSIQGGYRVATQDGDGMILSETIVSPPPSHYEVSAYSTLVDSLNDQAVTSLSNNAGPVTGNVAWGFEWDMTIAAGSNVLISKDKQIRPVPEPAGLALVGLAALMAARRRRA